MIEKISIRNVRVFSEKYWDIVCAPLTVLTGVNSAGKSTALKIPLLLKQTLEFGTKSTWPAGKMLLSGEDLDLGDFETLVSAGHDTKGFSIGLEFRDAYPIGNLKHALKKELIEDLKKKGEEIELLAVWKADFTKELGNGRDASLEKFSLSLHHEEEEVFRFSVERLENPISKTAKYIMHFPAQYFVNLKVDTVLKTELGADGTTRSCAVNMASCLPTHFETVWLKHNILGSYPLPPLIADAVRSTKKALESLHYIGPFRAPGVRYYITRGELTKLDSVGNFVPFVLKNNIDDEIVYVAPNSSGSPRTATLRTALNEWLNYFRTGDNSSDADAKNSEFEFQTTNSTFGELRLKSPIGKSSHAIVDSGFGYSQILPIIVRALMCKPGETLIIEQPELHLNPALQVRCAFFLYQVMKSGRRFIIETHSEHLVNMLRVLSVEGDRQDEVVIHFFELTSQGLNCVKLAMDKYGNFEHWPKSFFGEALELSARLLKAQSKTRKG